MAQFKVTLRLYIAGYEKISIHEVEADSPEDAQYTALCDETHTVPLTRHRFNNGEEWWDDFMKYTVESIEEIK